VIEHAPPASIETLWARPDLAAVFMCGLPYSRAQPPPQIIAAPVPSPAAFAHTASYFSEWIVAATHRARSLPETFGERLALTASHSQSGFIAPLTHLRAFTRSPLYREVIAPTDTPLGALHAVVDESAEVAAIDGYAWCLLERFRPELTRQVRRIDRTALSPIPALVASPAVLPEHRTALRQAFLSAHSLPALRPVLEELLLERFVAPDPHPYESMRRSAEETLAHWRSHKLATQVDPRFPELLLA
jgi:ABC-type phosphate/phosphonate transport system substrate-binding protein